MTFLPVIPHLIASALVGLGIFAMLSRRHAMAVLMGVELILAGIGIILVTHAVSTGAPSSAVLALFVITIAAAEVVLALAVLILWRARAGHIDTREPT